MASNVPAGGVDVDRRRTGGRGCLEMEDDNGETIHKMIAPWMCNYWYYLIICCRQVVHVLAAFFKIYLLTNRAHMIEHAKKIKDAVRLSRLVRIQRACSWRIPCVAQPRTPYKISAEALFPNVTSCLATIVADADSC